MKNDAKPKTARKALRDVSNSHAGAGRPSTPPNTATKKKSQHKQEDQNDAALDRLLLVQSDLSALINQIDKLVVEAFKCKAGASKEVESFTHFLSELHSSLKPWVPRFQKAVSNDEEEAVVGEIRSPEVERKEVVESVEESDSEEPLVSPSPLVSWRADCTIQRGQQLFMLTPLPMSKSMSCKPPMPSKPLVFERVSSRTCERMPFYANTGGDFNAGVVSTPQAKIGGSMMMNLMTPCLKSPPKSCVMLEPISDSSPEGHHLVCNRKSTPYPTGIRYAGDSSSSDTFEDEDASPDWCMSPPKSCVLLEPYDEKSLDEVGRIQDTQLNGLLLKQNVGVGGTQQYRTGGGRFAVESTPIWKQAGSTIVRKEKHPGENTLKRELWVKFEAASEKELSIDDPVPQKKLLDLLDEAS